MQSKSDVQGQNCLNSPCRLPQDYLDWNVSTAKSHLINYSTRASTVRLSETQQQMYSHGVIKQVMQASRLRSIEHDIHRIEPQTALYSKPIKKVKDQFKFDSIPSTNRMYASNCYSKVNHIKEGLKDGKVNYSVVCYKNSTGKATKNRPLSAASRINTKNPKVSVSGLVSYNFNSVNARKSLGLSKLNHEQLMVDQLKTESRRQYCGSERAQRILAKTSGKRFTKHYKNQQAIMKDLQSQTNNYLHDMRQKNEDHTLIYNERPKKLTFIKEYMAQENVDYEEAAHVVNEIQNSQPNQAPTKKQEQKKIDPNDEAFLRCRRMPCQFKPLFVRNFTFME